MKTDKLASDMKPGRMCCICRKRLPQAAMQRYTLDVRGDLQADRKGKNSGRGWYCCDSARCQKLFAIKGPELARRKLLMRQRSQGEI